MSFPSVREWQQQLLEKHNEIRTQHHLPPFQWNFGHADRAFALCQQMNQENRAFHGDLSNITFQNVAMGKKNFVRNPGKSVEVWLLDPGHAAPILDPSLRFLGASFFHNLLTNDVYICANYT